MISNKKKALLHVAKNQLGLDDDLYREILYQEAGVKSSTKLSDKGFKKVMRRFEKLGFKSKPKKPKRKRENKPHGVITPGMQDLINELYNKLGWDDSKRQIGFNRRQIGKPWPQTRAEANKIIEALKAMVRRGYK
ncbi:MAG: hypothetical protein PWR10_1559 [Halanaerobiales bacterium]|nr:hypothetical protein [Halanaerobiales bacterium]